MNEQVGLKRFASGTRPLEPRSRTLEDALADAEATMEFVRENGRFRGHYTKGTSPQIRRMTERMLGERPDNDEIFEIISNFYRRRMEALEPQNELEKKFETACRNFGVSMELGKGPLLVELVEKRYKPDKDFESLLESTLSALLISDENERHAAKYFLGKVFGPRGQKKFKTARAGSKLLVAPALEYEEFQQLEMDEREFAPVEQDGNQ